MAQHDNHEYRFSVIEKRLDKLDQVHEIVTRLDERFDKFDAVYDRRVSTVEKVQEDHDKDLNDLKTFKWKAAGVISIFLVIISIFGSAIGNAIVKKITGAPKPPQTQAQLDYYTETNLAGIVRAKDLILKDSSLIQSKTAH